MARVLLISINRCADPYPVFPLGLAYLDRALRGAGHETEWFDVNVDQEPMHEVLARVSPDFIGLSLRNIDDVVIKSRTTYFGELISICAELKRLTKVPIVLGGSGFSIFPERLLELSGADYGICGQGETSFLALLEKQPHSAIPGLVFRQAGGVVCNPVTSEPVVAETSAMVVPERLSDFYLGASSMLNIQTQRGCAQHCCYCTYPLLEGRQHRYRPAADVTAELRELQSRGAKYVFIVDSVFNSSREPMRAVCNAIISEGIRLKWGCFLRPAGLTDDLMELMAAAGLSHIEFGSDSFCDSVLEAYGKRFTFADILESSDLARKHKVEFCHFLVCGGPDETRETLQQTFENSLRIRDNLALALVGLRIYPGTPLYERAQREGVIEPEDDLLEPRYYLTRELTEPAIFKQLQSFRQLSPSWIVGEAAEQYMAMAKRLRAKGVVGPLWSYFGMIQRLGLSRTSAS
ncbi:MAG: lipid biosynthesis B12-binding/radical SAM protein [Limisphaerales bacterium]